MDKTNLGISQSRYISPTPGNVGVICLVGSSLDFESPDSICLLGGVQYFGIVWIFGLNIQSEHWTSTSNAHHESCEDSSEPDCSDTFDDEEPPPAPDTM
jgi:hypothetical protein